MDVDSFLNNIFDFSQSPHRKVHVNKGSYKNFFQSSCSNLAIWRYSSVITSKKEWTLLKENSLLWLIICAIFPELLPNRAGGLQIPLPRPKLQTTYTSSIDNLFEHHYEEIIDNSKRQFCSSFRFQTGLFCVFPSQFEATTYSVHGYGNCQP